MGAVVTQLEKQITTWCRNVINGKVVASRWVVLAVKRHQSDLERAKNKNCKWKFDKTKAIPAIQFFPSFLKHTKGTFAGNPFHLSPSQLFIVWNIFGWRNRKTGYRRFKRIFITVARKWGKSTFIAGLALYCLFAGFPIEPGGEIYCAATKEEQASIVHTQAVKMVEGCQSLNSRATIYKNRDRYKSLVLDEKPWLGAFFKPIGSDSKSSDGLNPSVVVKDELHEWSKHHKGLKDKLETAGGARAQPLDITISTAGDELSSFFNADDLAATTMLEAASRGQHINETLFAFVARLEEKRPCDCLKQNPECTKCPCQQCKKGIKEDGTECKCKNLPTGTIPADDVFDERNWPKANPDIGCTPSFEYMREQAERAAAEPAFLNTFKRYHCNVQVSSRVKLINADVWAKGYNPQIPWDQAEALCGGFDLGWRNDLSGHVIAGRFDHRGQIRYGFKALTFCCDNGVRKLVDEPWCNYLDQGWLVSTGGNTTDIPVFRDSVLAVSKQTGNQHWRFDPANARQLGTELANEHGLVAVEFGQTHGRYNEPLRELIRAIAAGEVWHEGDELLNWQVNNAIGNKNAKGQIMPDKDKSPDKIDTFAAMVMAFSGVMAGMDDETQQSSDYYEDNDLESG